MKFEEAVKMAVEGKEMRTANYRMLWDKEELRIDLYFLSKGEYSLVSPIEIKCVIEKCQDNWREKSIKMTPKEFIEHANKELNIELSYLFCGEFYEITNSHYFTMNKLNEMMGTCIELLEDEWVKVKDRAPTREGQLILFFSCWRIYLGKCFFVGERLSWIEEDGLVEINGVTHWKNLSPPKKHLK